MYWAGRVVGHFGRWGHTCLAADEEMAFLSSRSSSSARAEGVTGLAAPKRRERKGEKKHVHFTLSVYALMVI